MKTILGVIPDADLNAFVSDGLTGVDWIRAGAIVVGTIAVAIIVNRIVRSMLGRTLGHGFAAIITARIAGYLLVLVGLVYALTTLGVRVGPLLGALGLGGLVLALALQKVVENFAGSIILQARRPFTIGDTVHLDGHTGIVTDIDSRTTVLQGLDGTQIRIPNSEVLLTPIVNLTRAPLRRSELVVGVAYDTNLDRATEVIRSSVDRVERISARPEPLVLLREFASSSIEFTVYYWHASDVPTELATRHDLHLAIHHAFADAGITIAFPQVVVWSGHDADADPYDEAPGPVFTEQPRQPERPDQPARRWRLGRRS